MKTLKLTILLGTAGLLAACGNFLGAGVQSYKDTNTGKETYKLTCTGVAVGWETCKSSAAELCPQGYVTLQTNEKPPRPKDEHVFGQRRYEKDIDREMTVQCK